MTAVAALRTGVSQTAMSVRLRPFQAEAVEATLQVLAEDPTAAPLVVIPTGGGKSIILAMIANRYMAANPRKRVLVVTHVGELVEQNYKAFRRICPHAYAGIYSAGLGRKDKRCDITFASVQSIARVAEQFRSVGLVLVDEAHLVPHVDQGQYHDLLRKLRDNGSDARLVGLTATPYRTNSGSLLEGFKEFDPMFTAISYELPILRLFSEGYLTRLVGMATATKLETPTGPGAMVAGEYNQKRLDETQNTDPLNRAIVDESVAFFRLKGLRSMLVFGVTVDHAARLCALYQRAGIRAAYLHADTPQHDRERMISDFKTGVLECLVNMAVLTTGFDAPGIDLIVLARSTMSPGLLVQMLGRGTRPMYGDYAAVMLRGEDTREGRLNAIATNGKPVCYVLDYAQNIAAHGLIDQITGIRKGRKKPGEEDEAITKTCGSCDAINALSSKVCSNCGEPFGAGGEPPDREAKLIKQGGVTKIVTEASETFEFAVIRADVTVIRTKDGNPLMKIVYACDDTKGQVVQVSEIVDFDARDELGFMTHWARRKAEQWWRQRSNLRPPATSQEAMSRLGELRSPRRLMARINKTGWLNVVGCEF